MTYDFRIRLLAKEDIQHIIDYYDSKAPMVTDRFLDRLFREFEVLKQNPLLFESKYKNTRVRFIEGFPYVIHYVITLCNTRKENN